MGNNSLRHPRTEAAARDLLQLPPQEELSALVVILNKAQGELAD